MQSASDEQCHVQRSACEQNQATFLDSSSGTEQNTRRGGPTSPQDLRFIYIHLSDKEQGVEVPYAVDDPGLAETVGHLLRAWREGVFPHTVEAGTCTFCEFRELCGPPQRVCAQSQVKLDNADNNMLDAWRELQHD